MYNLKSGKYSVIAQEYEDETMPLGVEIKNSKITKIIPKKEMIPGGLKKLFLPKYQMKLSKNKA